MPFRLVPLAGLPIFLAFACAHTSSRSGFDEPYQRMLRACEQIYLPNAMALADGVDADTRANHLEEERRSLAKTFETPDGRRFLEAHRNSSTDDVEKRCVNSALGSAG